MKKGNFSRSLNPRGNYWIWYALPALVIYIVFMAYPLLDSVRLSLYTGNAVNREFIGFGNFVKLFTDETYSKQYWNALSNTVVFFIIHMLVQNVLGMLFAVLLTNNKMRGAKFYQTVIFIPTTFAVLVTGYLWKLLLNPVWSKGFLSAIGLSSLAQPWLGQESTALIAVALVSCWQWMGIPTMMFVAALRNIPDDYYEAASIEGASSWDIFWRIKLPLLKPQVGMISILTFVNNFNAFDIIFSMETANGAPGYATDLIGTLFYRTGIAGQHPIGIPDPGMGAAIATITFILLAIGSLMTLRYTRTKD
ncbi:sugar ABC transporter permease [Christensenellaceae bacterium OttesenSCG-928-M15]|nr:sugar ABC transporter permease [Christensenellaceae bacterium OttesenSCG-928-M15]